MKVQILKLDKSITETNLPGDIKSLLYITKFNLIQEIECEYWQQIDNVFNFSNKNRHIIATFCFNKGTYFVKEII